MSSGIIITLSILEYPESKWMTEEIEGDSNSEQWEVFGWNLLWLRIDKGARKFLGYWAI